MSDLKATIEEAFERRAEITPDSAPTDVREAVDATMGMLDSGELRVAEKRDGDWVVNEWAKKAVLLSFRLVDNYIMNGGSATQYFDKVPSKFEGWNDSEHRDSGVRIVPPAMARRGSYIAPGVVLMPSYVNLGAYVDSGTMVDTWATVGFARRLARTFTFRVAWASAVCSNRSKLHRRLLKTTALSVRARKSWRASSLRKAPLSRWVFISDRVRAFMTALPERSFTAASRRGQSSYPVTSPLRTVRTACTAPSLSNVLTKAPKKTSINELLRGV